MLARIRLGAAAAALLALTPGATANAPAGGDPYAPAVARTIKAIFEYSRWPQPRSPLVLCVTSGAQHAALIGNLRLTDGRQVVRRNVAAQAGAMAGCDALYIGSIPVAAQRSLTAAVRGKGVLTIAENDPGSSSEAMFALSYKPGSVSFRLNIDAVSRSGLKVDPRVLRVARGGA